MANDSSKNLKKRLMDYHKSISRNDFKFYGFFVTQNNYRSAVTVSPSDSSSIMIANLVFLSLGVIAIIIVIVIVAKSGKVDD